MKVVHVTSGRGAAVGGISAAVAGFMRAHSRRNDSVAWVASQEHRGRSWTANVCRAVAAERPDLVHTHGLWLEPSRVAYRSARAGVPTLLSPHGMADPWAMRRHGGVKRLLWRFREQGNLAKVHCIHALCAAEANAIRSLGVQQPIVVVPNGVELPVRPRQSHSSSPWGAPVPEGARVLLFLGRFHEKKGITPLLEAWQAVSSSPLTQDWCLVFVGYADGRGPLGSSGGKLPPRVHVHGAAFGEDKAACFAHANAFVLPSFSEGLPMAVLEAWSYGLPVLMSRECNLEAAFAQGAALEIRPEATSISQGILSLCEMSLAESHVMGARGRNLVEKSYSWQVVGQQMNRVYRWLLGQGPEPEGLL